MHHLASAPARLPAQPSPSAPGAAASLPPTLPPAADSAFWSERLASGAAVIASLCPHIDALSLRMGQLALRPALTRPVVGQYLTMVRTLAAAWHARTRPALVAALGALGHFGDSVCQAGALDALAARRADGGQAARRALDALARRLAAPRAAFHALDTDLASYLRQMAGISAELDADTLLVTGRLQADAMHAFLLSQQACTLQGKLDDARMRSHAPWVAGPHAAALQQEICLHASALEGVRRQLDCLRAEQAATQAEADYLHSVLPGVGAFLAAVDRAGAAIGALAGGTRALGAALEGLALQEDAPAMARAAASMDAALPHWRALSEALGALRPGWPGQEPGLRKPGAFRT